MMKDNGLAKLIEECGELIQIAAKKQAYFNTDSHPDGKGSMKERMEDEIADVLAACVFVAETFKLNQPDIEGRAKGKLELFRKWHKAPN